MEVEPILDKFMDGPLKRASLPVQGLGKMDIEDSDSGSRAMDIAERVAMNLPRVEMVSADQNVGAELLLRAIP